MRRSARVEEGAVQLLSRVLWKMPRLPGAACVSARGKFYEAELGFRVRECIAICRQCPALEPCKSWAATTPRPIVGVLAGRYHGFTEPDDETGQDNGGK